MNITIVNREEVKKLLSMRDCIELVAKAHSKLAHGNAIQPLRQGFVVSQGKGVIATMPAYIDSVGDESPVLGLKTVSVFHGNVEVNIGTHQASILLMEPDTGQLIALIDGTEITAIRTAAASAVASRILAKENLTGDLAILGSGVQAYTHLEAMAVCHDIQRVRVWSRQYKHAQQFAEHATQVSKIPIEPMETVKETVKNADLIITVTASVNPILEAQWVSPGCHISAVGSSLPNMREIDSELARTAKIFTDVRESALNEAGDILIPIKEGVLESDPILADLGQLVNGDHPGRTSPEEITLYKSLGVGIQDLATAEFIYRKAREANFGVQVPF